MTDRDESGTNPPPLPPPAPTSEEEMRVFMESVVGFNYRLIDNVLQLAIVVICTLAGAAIGYFELFGWSLGSPSNPGGSAVIGALLGIVSGVLISGIILMVIGRRRAAKIRAIKKQRGL